MTYEKERLLRPVRRRLRRHQRLRLRGDRDRAQAQGQDRQDLCRATRHHRRPHRRHDRHRQGKRRGHPRVALHAGGRLRLGALQALRDRQEPRPVRAPDRGFQGARHRLFLLQRRQRLHGHRPQGVGDRRVKWAIPSPASGFPRRSTTIWRSPIAVPDSARRRNTSRCRPARRRSTCCRWRAPRPRCSCSRSWAVMRVGLRRREAWRASARRCAAHHSVSRDRLRAHRSSSPR